MGLREVGGGARRWERVYPITEIKAGDWWIMNIFITAMCGCFEWESELTRGCWHDGGIVGCLYTHKIRLYYCLSVILSAFPLYCFPCVSVRVLLSVCEWALLTSSTVTLWLLTTPISRMSGRRRERVWVYSERLWWAFVCLRDDVCEGVGDWELCTQMVCNPQREVHMIMQESLFFFYVVWRKWGH